MWRIVTFEFTGNPGIVSGTFGVEVDNSGVPITAPGNTGCNYINISGDQLTKCAYTAGALKFDIGNGGYFLTNFPSAVEGQTYTETAGTWSYVNGTGYTITTSASTGGSISPSGSVPAIEGYPKTFEITPNLDYEVSSVLVDGVEAKQDLVNNTYTFTNIQSDHTISVFFERNLIITTRIRTVTYSKGGKGGLTPYTTFSIRVDEFGHPYTGTYQHISGSSFTRAEYNASTDLFELYSKGETLSMKNFSAALPNQPYSEGSDEWIYDLSVSTEYTITPSITGNGSISPDEPTLVDEGEDQTFEMTPDEGYYITSVLVDGVESISELVDNTYTFTNVNDVHTIEVTFGDEPPKPTQSYGFNFEGMIDIDYMREI